GVAASVYFYLLAGGSELPHPELSTMNSAICVNREKWPERFISRIPFGLGSNSSAENGGGDSIFTLYTVSAADSHAPPQVDGRRRLGSRITLPMIVIRLRPVCLIR